MKKLFTLLVVLAGCVCTASAVTVYFKPDTGQWNKYGATFGLNMKNGSDVKLVQMTQIGTTGIFYATYDDNYPQFEFLRYNPDFSTYWGMYSALMDKPTTSIYYDKSNNDWQNSWTGSTGNMTVRTIYDRITLDAWHHITVNYEEYKRDTDVNVLEMNSTTGVNTLQVTGRALKAGNYTYKFYVDNSAWIPSGDDLTLNIAADGIYTITYTYNQFSNTYSASAEKTADATVEYKYYVYEDANGITGNSWTSNQMTIEGSKATLTVSDVDLTKGRDTKFKIVEVVNDGTSDVHTYWSYSGTDDNLWHLIPQQSTTCDVVFTWEIPNTWRFNASNVYAALVPKAYSWYFVVSNGGVWTIGDKLTETGDGTNVFKGTITDWQGNFFALTPSSNITSAGAIGDWGQVVRPAQDNSNYWIGFYTYGAADTKTQAADGSQYNYVWVHNIEQGGSIEFTFDAANKKWNADPYISRAITSAGYATFCIFNNEGLKATIPAGVTAKYASRVSAGNITWTTLSTGIPYNQGVLLQAAEGTYKFTPAGSADDLTGNLLKPIANKKQLAQVTETGYTNFILANGGGGVGFYKPATGAGSWCNAGTAYLQVPDGDVSARGFFLFDDDTTTKIAAAERNGNVGNGEYYNLAGQRIAQPTKGLYIVNGKKVIIK